MSNNGASTLIKYRKALNEEIDQLKQLLWQYGPNEWNFLSTEGVDSEFALMESGQARTLVATLDDGIIGFAVLIDGKVSPGYLHKYCSMEDMQFIGDVVVSSSHAGKGIATKLLSECLAQAKTLNAKTVLIERHEENLASAGMMRKAGFEVIDTFHDPEKRSAGSQNSVILEFKL